MEVIAKGDRPLTGSPVTVEVVTKQGKETIDLEWGMKGVLRKIYEDVVEEVGVGGVGKTGGVEVRVKKGNRKLTKSVEDAVILDTATELKEEGNMMVKTDPQYSNDCYTKALNLLEKCSSKPPTPLSLSLHLNASLTFLKTNNPSPALSHATTALTLDPSNPKALFRAGLACKSLHKDDDALNYMHRILKADPKHKEARKEAEEMGRKKIEDVKREKAVCEKMFS